VIESIFAWRSRNAALSRQKIKILIVEEEIEMVRMLQRSLIAQNYEVVIAQNGGKALSIVQQQSPDLILLDLELPGMSGLEVCRRVRENSLDPPIIIISVQDRERDKVYALDLGADDYLSKPFGIDEVLARIRVALRHADRVSPKLEGEPVVTLGPLHVDFTQHLVFVNGQEVKLTPTEYDLLKVFLQHRGKIVTQRMLLTQVWGKKYDTRSHYLHVYISHLRRKIEPDAANRRFFRTIFGVGYRFCDDAYE
jgi:two-component system KDP operon response regulator KdpE